MNKGKDLENIVRKFEEVLLGEGYTVESNEKIIEDGVQIAEFDIIIKGKIGTAQVKHLIECRDRPSAGPQPRNWIQTLMGRKTDFGFNGVTAVSSTGFTKGAIALAKEQGIGLRKVIDADSIDRDLRLISFTLANPMIIPESTVTFDIDPKYTELVSSGIYDFEYRKLKIRKKGEEKYLSFSNFVLENLPSYLSKEKKGIHRFSFCHNKPIEIKYDKIYMEGRNLQARLRYETLDEEGKVMALKNYLDDEEGILGQELEVVFYPPIGAVRIRLTFTYNDGLVHVNFVECDLPDPPEYISNRKTSIESYLEQKKKNTPTSRSSHPE